ncbi:putative amid-like NADH oxidoreductase [Pyrenochaeta sp. DS3sAY3a]|nr:putative amid-like NADH oxidoreductase [Pyrenochaeta sp. DS3sAY3a]
MAEVTPPGPIKELDPVVQDVSVKEDVSFLDKIRLYGSMLSIMIPYGLRLLRFKLAAIHHNLTYKPVDSPQNIVVVGGSFAGIQIAKYLADAVPTGYRVVLVEKNSHFNYLFAFPRFAAVTGYEREAFIPYEGILGGGIKKGALLHVHAEAASVTDKQVVLKNGETIDYAYLILATGSAQQPPAKMTALDREGACEEMRGIQQSIAGAKSVAVVGAGAVGVEIAGDVKTYFPDKNVTLFSSRDAVMPGFGKKLQVRVGDILKGLDVDVRCNARPKVLPGGKSVQLADGKVEEFDVVLSCTGQIPSSGILSTLLPNAISAQNGRVLVNPQLQVQTSAGTVSTNIFALGDVAEHGGPRMARAVFMQAGVVRNNVLDLIRGRAPSQKYTPQVWVEGLIQLTVGKDVSLLYMPGKDGKDMIMPGPRYPDDFHIARGWRLVGAKYPGRESSSK